MDSRGRFRRPLTLGSVRAKRFACSLAAAAVIFLAGKELAPGFFLFSGSLQEEARTLPEFTSTDPDRWLNSPPLKLADLKGQVILLDIWTFG